MHVDPVLAIEVLYGRGRERAAQEEADAVDQDVHSSERRERPAGQGAHLLVLRQIGREGLDRRREIASPLRHEAERLAIPSAEHEARPLARQLDRDRLADPAARTRDHRHLALETLHDVSSSKLTSSNASAASRIAAKLIPDRSAISSRPCSPSERFKTQRRASSRARPASSPPIVR